MGIVWIGTTITDKHTKFNTLLTEYRRVANGRDKTKIFMMRILHTQTKADVVNISKYVDFLLLDIKNNETIYNYEKGVKPAPGKCIRYMGKRYTTKEFELILTLLDN